MASIDCLRSKMPKNGIHFFHASKIDRILAYWNLTMWPCVSSLFEWSLIIIEQNNSFLMTISYLKLVVNIGLIFNFHKNLKKASNADCLAFQSVFGQKNATKWNFQYFAKSWTSEKKNFWITRTKNSIAILHGIVWGL